MSAATKSQLLIIVNNIRPYGSELTNILAAPIGSSCRFRYQTKYAPTISNVTSLLGKDGTIVLRDFASSEFLPVRLFHTSQACTIGDIVYVTVELQASAAISDGEYSAEQLRQFNVSMKESIGTFENLPGGNLMNLILYEDGSIYNQLTRWAEASVKGEVEHWGNCINNMATKPSMADFDYFKVVALRDSRNNLIQFHSGNTDKKGYVLASGESYTLEVVQRTYTGKKGDSSVPGNRFLELTSSDDKLQVLRGKKPILGKYDILQYHIRTNDTAKPALIQMFIVANSETTDYRTPALEIPVTVIPSKRVIWSQKISQFLFLIFLWLYVFPDGIISILPAHWSIQSSVIEKITIIGMIITASASGRFGQQISDRFSMGIR